MKTRSASSIVERADHSDTSLDPVTLRQVAWNVHSETEVGGVPSRGEGSRSSEGLVDGAVVDAARWLLALILRQQPDQRELSVELLRGRLI